jgi:hypothetical protein
MLAYKTHAQLVEAAASVMRWYALAMVNASTASASRGLALWTEWLEAATAGQPANGGAGPQRAMMPAWPWMPAPMPNASGSAGMWWLGPGASWWVQAPAWAAWSRAPMSGWNGWLTQVRPATPAGKAPTGTTVQATADPGVTAYRSGGGHAVAQVVMGKANGQANGKSPPGGTR